MCASNVGTRRVDRLEFGRPPRYSVLVPRLRSYLPTYLRPEFAQIEPSYLPTMYPLLPSELPTSKRNVTQAWAPPPDKPASRQSSSRQGAKTAASGKAPTWSFPRLIDLAGRTSSSPAPPSQTTPSCSWPRSRWYYSTWSSQRRYASLLYRSTHLPPFFGRIVRTVASTHLFMSPPLSLAVLRPCPTRAAAAPRRRRALVGPDGLRRAPRRLRLLGLLGGPSVRRPHARSQPHARSGLPMRRVHGLARACRRAARGARAAAPRCGLPVRRLREHLRAGVAMRRGVSRRFFPRHGRGGRTSPRPIAEGCTVFGLA